jgi:hypothetical protein
MLKPIACLCLVLISWPALALASHHHTSATDQVQCTVCLAARSASPVPVHHSGRVNFSPVAIAPMKPVPVQLRRPVFAMSVRPPPAA